MSHSAIAAPEEKKFRVLSASVLDPCLLRASVLLGLLHSWMSRYSMNPDGMSYLDVGDSFFHHDWAHAVNAWWSPLYPWLVGTAVGIFKPSIKWEFPLVHAVNFGIFVAALLAFRFLLNALRASPLKSANRVGNPLPDWALVLLGYSIFWWIALEVQSLYSVGPDLLALTCFCLVVAMLLRAQPENGLLRFGLIGAVLGIAYWAKAVMFPLGFAILAGAYVWR